jgi:iron complex transport system ATP-binding protein
MPEEIITDGTIQKLYEIEGAYYNELMGSLEFHNMRNPEIFVTGGNGTGAGVYRALSRAGFGLACGILHSNDVDAYIGKSLNCMVIEEHPFTAISEGCFQEAGAILNMVNYLVDTGFPLGESNLRNLELVTHAVQKGTKVYSLCDVKEAKNRYGEYAGGIQCCKNICELIQKLTEEKGRKYVNAH